MTSQPHSLQPCSMPLQQPLQHPKSTQYATQPSRYAVPLQPHPPQFNTAPASIQQHRHYHSTLSSFISHVPQGQDSVFTASKGDQRNYAPIFIVVVAVNTFHQAAEPEVPSLNGNGFPPQDRE